MRRKRTSPIFDKKFKKLKGQELANVISKIEEVIFCEDINHYKNLKKPFNKFKRVHVNDSFVILFFGDDGSVYFIDYSHHDEIYKISKKKLERYLSYFS